MTFNNWEKALLKDVMIFNPRESIKKGTMAKKIGMSRLNEFNRTIDGYEVTEFKSGTKFRNGDTLLARITPCLENGKTAQVSVLDDGEVGFGSTEFIVLREKEGLTDKDFIYYLAISDNLRQVAIKSMTGTTGRQRAQKDVLENTSISLPSLQEQKAIANVLSTLDEKIEVNNQINETLENMAQALFKQWFVDFEFPNENGEPYKSSGGEMVESEIGLIPETWEIGNLSKFVDNIIGGDWGKNTPQKNYKEKVYCIRGADINELNKGNSGKVPIRFILEKNLNKKELQDGNLIVEISGGSPTQSTGRIGYVSKELLDRFDAPVVCTNFCRSIKLRNDIYQEFFYYFWKFLYDQKIFFNFENGTTGIKNLDLSSLLNNYNVVIPELHYIKKFSFIAKEINKNIKVTGLQNKKLREIRDTLLPKLMSGEIRVPLDELEESMTQ
ncbi:restriction endonuclease subunit S [Alkalibacterium putridalgicola]|uniref:restriction endonuclease subunit S n=1 Tax=Alkalibacterium putridalgicola TaxID=426703 RepID=UPI0034CFEF3D